MWRKEVLPKRQRRSPTLLDVSIYFPDNPLARPPLDDDVTFVNLLLVDVAAGARIISHRFLRCSQHQALRIVQQGTSGRSSSNMRLMRRDLE